MTSQEGSNFGDIPKSEESYPGNEVLKHISESKITARRKSTEFSNRFHRCSNLKSWMSLNLNEIKVKG